MALILLSCIFSMNLHAASYVFISFSMPERLLIETLRDSAELHIPAVLNGLVENSFEKTAQKIMVLTQEVPGLSLQIDPIAFERFHIQQVPALVVSNRDCFDVIYGHLSLKEGLNRIHEKGECGRRGAS